MDIFEHLKKDHRKVASIMQQIEDCDTEQRRELFVQLKDELLRHARAEEQTFYATLERYEEAEDLIEEAKDDHRLIETMLRELDGLPPEETSWLSKFQELRQSVEDHVEQEETEIFDEARDVLDDRQANELERSMSEHERNVTTA